MNESHFVVTEHGGIDPAAESPRFVAKHLSAYTFVLPYAKGVVLEVGCGDGYGASFLAETASDVTAIDLFEANVRHASQKYRRSNLRFLPMNATSLEFPEKSFDLIVSFQVIEHIPESRLPVYIAEMQRVLKKGGKICLSTLNLAKNKKPNQPYQKSPHHDKEFTADELRDFLRPHFQSVELYGLYPTRRHLFFERLKKSGLCGRLPPSFNPVSRYYESIGVHDFEWRNEAKLKECIDLMAVCYDG